jgi:hypothetical protein
MSVTVLESSTPRVYTNGSSQELEVNYVLMGTPDEAVASQALQDGSATTLHDLNRSRWRVEPLFVDDVAAEGLWLGVVTYTPFERTVFKTNDVAFNFEVAAGTQHITQALRHILTASCPGFTAEEYNGAINVTGESDNLQVQGVDISIPTYTFSETHYLPDGAITNTYKGIIYGLVGKVNDAGFKGLAAGECLFTACSGSRRGKEDWEVTFRFAGSPNVADWCADWPTGVKPSVAVAKKGWEYVWVRYKAGKGTNGLVPKPMSVHVEQVYRGGGMGALNIGT